MAATDTGDPRARSVASVASAAPPPASARTVEAWAEAYIRTTSLERKLRPGPVPARFASDAQARPAIPRRIERPGRPEVFQPPRGKVKYGGLRSGRSRAHLLHRFFGHELQAAELMCWAVLAFPDTPRAFRRGLVGVALDEVRHMNLYATQIARLGYALGDFPLNDWFWQRIPASRTPLSFLAAMSLGFEAANLDHSGDFAARFRQVGDDEAAAVQEQVAREELAHVRFGASWFRRFHGALTFDAWVAALPPPLSPMVMRGRAIDEDARARAGLDARYIERLALRLRRWMPSTMHPVSA